MKTLKPSSAILQDETVNYKCEALCHLVPFVQFKKRENTHRGVLLLVKLQAEVLVDIGCFSRFLNCTNGTKWLKASQICRLFSEVYLGLCQASMIEPFVEIVYGF